MRPAAAAGLVELPVVQQLADRAAAAVDGSAVCRMQRCFSARHILMAKHTEVEEVLIAL